MTARRKNVKTRMAIVEEDRMFGVLFAIYDNSPKVHRQTSLRQLNESVR